MQWIAKPMACGSAQPLFQDKLKHNNKIPSVDSTDRDVRKQRDRCGPATSGADGEAEDSSNRPLKFAL